MADHGLDGGTASQFALDGAEDTALLAGDTALLAGDKDAAMPALIAPLCGLGARDGTQLASSRYALGAPERSFSHVRL